MGHHWPYLLWKNRNKMVSLYGDDVDGGRKEDEICQQPFLIGESYSLLRLRLYRGCTWRMTRIYLRIVGAEPGDAMFGILVGNQTVYRVNILSLEPMTEKY